MRHSRAEITKGRLIAKPILFTALQRKRCSEHRARLPDGAFSSLFREHICGRWWLTGSGGCGARAPSVTALPVGESVRGWQKGCRFGMRGGEGVAHPACGFDDLGGDLDQAHPQGGELGGGKRLRPGDGIAEFEHQPIGAGCEQQDAPDWQAASGNWCGLK